MAKKIADAIKPGKGNRADRRKAAAKSGKAAKVKATDKAAARAAARASATGDDEEEDEEDIDEDEEDDVDDDEDDEDEEEDDTLETEDEEEDEDEEDEEEDEDKSKKSKDKDKSKSKKPKTRTLTEAEYRRLKAQARETEEERKRSEKAKSRAAAEREEKVAAKDGVKALELARKRLNRELDRRDAELEKLRSHNETLSNRYSSQLIKDEFDEVLSSVLSEREMELRKGALKHVRAAYRGEFEAQEDDDGEFTVVHRETGQALDEFLAEIVDDEDFGVFLKDDEGETPRGERKAAKVRGTAKGERRGKEEKEDKDKSYSQRYKDRMKELQEAGGFRPARGLARPAESRNGKK
jgi:hypothetical protein